MSEIRKIYFAHFFVGLTNAASVTFTLYFLSHGLTQLQIGQLFGIFMITLAIFDIPTGGLADMFGHKASVATGFLMQALSFLLFFAYPNYYGFLLAFLASAIGLAFQSGALSSLIYEILRKNNLQHDFQKIKGRADGYFLIAAIIASPIGAFVYKFYPSLPYFFAFIAFLFSAVSIFLIKWEFIKPPRNFRVYLSNLFEGIKLTIKNKILISLVIIGVALSVNRLVFNQNIGQPYQVSVGIDVAYIGVIASIVAAVQAIISINAYKISQKIGKAPSLFLIVLIPSASVIILSFINNLLAIPFILFLFMGHAFREPVMAHISQEEVENDKRATMASSMSFISSLIVGLLLPYWGKGIDVFGIPNSLFLLGAFSFIVGMVGLQRFISKSRV